jgi:thioredoxin reductase/Pyruvate/2-oxoacid:ferredoxin oxidoreductase delta subunit
MTSAQGVAAEEAVREALAAIAGIPADAAARLSPVARRLRLGCGERLSAHATVASETYYFIQRGRLSVVVEPERGARSALVFGSKVRHDAAHVALLLPGELLSDGFFAEAVGVPVGAERVDVVALIETELVALPQNELATVLARWPRWRARLAATVSAVRARVAAQEHPARRVAQEFCLRHGLAAARGLKAIDLERCIGCDACEQACAARHGVSRLVRHGATLGRLCLASACRQCDDPRCVEACGFHAISDGADGVIQIDPRACMGCRGCMNACPNGALEMVETPYTAADFPQPIPQTDRAGQTNVPGLYLVGDAAGDGLIKLAINAGHRAAAHLAARAKAAAAASHDVAVVGAGPAGLSAALACKELGLDYVLFEKGDIASTIRAYPKSKLVMAEPAHLPLYGQLWLQNSSKEQLIETWLSIVARTGLKVTTGTEITAVEPDAGGGFVLRAGERAVTARTVVLCTGNRGSPRKLGVPGETPQRVRYALSDAEEFVGLAVLVVGGGDSAVEAALALVAVPGTRVTLSYRRSAFARIKPGNKTRLDRAVAQGHLRLMLGSTVSSIETRTVVLESTKGPVTLQNDVVFAMLGADPPTTFFREAGIDIVQPGTPEMAELAVGRGTRQFASVCDRCAGHADRACMAACPTQALRDLEPSSVYAHLGAERAEAPLDLSPFIDGFDAPRISPQSARFGTTAAWLGLVLTLAVGFEVLVRRLLPEASALAWWARRVGSQIALEVSSGRGLGHALGYVGALMMLAAAFYPLRSRTPFGRWLGPKSVWLGVHIAMGLVGPALVTYHTLLKLDRWPVLGFYGMWLVVLTGVVGRYVATWASRTLGLVEFELEALASSRQRLFEAWRGVPGRTAVFAEEASKLDRVPVGSGVTAPLWLWWGELQSALRLTRWHRRARAWGAGYDLRRETLRVFARREAAHHKRATYQILRGSALIWRRIHLIVTILMFLLSAAHVVVALLYKAW